jgi:hypothetical protein
MLFTNVDVVIMVGAIVVVSSSYITIYIRIRNQFHDSHDYDYYFCYHCQYYYYYHYYYCSHSSPSRHHSHELLFSWRYNTKRQERWYTLEYINTKEFDWGIPDVTNNMHCVGKKSENKMRFWIEWSRRISKKIMEMLVIGSHYYYYFGWFDFSKQKNCHVVPLVRLLPFNLIVSSVSWQRLLQKLTTSNN